MKTNAALMIIPMIATSTLAKDVPSNLWDFHNLIKGSKCAGGTVLQDDLYDISQEDGGSESKSRTCTFRPRCSSYVIAKINTDKSSIRILPRS